MKNLVFSAIVAICSMLLGASVSLGAVSPGKNSVPGHAVLAKPDGAALIIWNASPVVAAIVRSTMNRSEIEHLMKQDALRVLAGMLPDLDTTLETVTVRLVYFKTGAVSPVYGALVFGNVENYATLTVTGKEVNRVKALHARSPLFRSFVYKVIGRLPAQIRSTPPKKL